jgi:hypothetical protein
MRYDEYTTIRGPAAREPRHRRAIVRWIALPLCALSFGCLGITNRNQTPPPPAARISQTPTKDDLIGYLNKNARLIQSLDARDLELDITSAGQTIGVSGNLYCQQPKNFRMRAKVAAVGKEVADIGSNEEEFWFWISENKPPDLYHCSYTDLTRGVRLPFPVQPEWVMEALGMARYDASRPNYREENFSVGTRGRTFELIEQAVSPQGQPVKKVTVFNDWNTGGTTPQVTALKVFDTTGK